MNKSDENLKIQNTLKIPISEFNWHMKNSEVNIKYGNNLKGSIPFIIADEKIIFDFGKNILSKLKWDNLYFLYQEEIERQIKEILKIEYDEITLGLFRTLYVKKNLDIIATVTCSFINGNWIVEK